MTGTVDLPNERDWKGRVEEGPCGSNHYMEGTKVVVKGGVITTSPHPTPTLTPSSQWTWSRTLSFKFPSVGDTRRGRRKTLGELGSKNDPPPRDDVETDRSGNWGTML